MELIHERERIFAQDDAGRTVAEITFPISGGTANINHTFVDASLRGQGAAGQLVQAAAEQIRAAGLKAYPTCSYARRWFDEHPEQADIL